MKIKNFKLTLVVALLAIAFASCDKSECHECHYDDADGNEVELGEQCDDELEDLEENGYNVGGVNYEVHCHDH